ELADEGRKSMVAGAPVGAELRSMLERSELRYSSPTDEASIKSAFRKLRVEADAWQRGRTAYMAQRLEAGRHPDTDPTFWSQYQDPGPPALASLQTQPILGLVDPLARGILIGIGSLFLILLVSGVVILRIVARRVRARRKSAIA